jgi:hypothetical protein
MKKRQGFVSNSSSSSFIINIGVVTDVICFQKMLQKFMIEEDNHNLTIIRGIQDYRENHDGKWGTPFDEGDWAGNYSSFSNVAKIWENDPDATIIVATEYGDEGDGMFYDEATDYDLDYDSIDLTWFNAFNVHLYEKASIKEDGLNIIHSCYGGGRNG